ncbi:uncharacterized protein BDR25DRAFT_120905 [Lindgomyces ingoldianus]|uniref:Uncharacterized protein n=1 Tax=Lindgomyces ingoldianus TaxID=673940 RepID=A0ACB6R660_9PLEO|nr:uncharacterized protein BDR25DRAFT_120905 [Lindgomyces ingoldianus]KAF2474323.1 hypothetical protein BDR25DRAFT_120905 [Lindgomyces ingoldianus]
MALTVAFVKLCMSSYEWYRRAAGPRTPHSHTATQPKTVPCTAPPQPIPGPHEPLRRASQPGPTIWVNLGAIPPRSIRILTRLVGESYLCFLQL